MKEGYSYTKNKNINVIWGAIWPFLLWFLIQFVVSFLFLFAAIIVNPAMTSSELDLFVNDNTLFVTLLCQIASLLIFLPIFFNKRRYFVSVDTKIKNNVLLFINIGLIIASIGIVSSFVLNLFKMSGLEEVNNMFNSNGFVMAFVVTVLMAPVVEEIIFRGLIFNRMNSKWNTWIAIIISSFLFGLAHGNLPQMINAFVIGFSFAYFYNKYHTLWPCIIGHVFNNFISIVCQRINYSMGGNYTIDCSISIYLQIAIMIITIIYSLLYYKKLAKN